MKRIAAFVFAFLSVCYLQIADADAQFRRECRYGFCAPGGGPTGTPISNACISTPGTTITFTAQGTGGANPRRISVVSINWSSAGSSELTAVTIGGISMVRAVRASSSALGNNSEIWFVANPTGTSSNIVLTASVALTGATIEVYSLIGYQSVVATTTGTTSVSQTYSNKQLAIAAGSRATNVSTAMSNMTNDFSSACGLGLWGVHASQALHGNGTLTSSISPASSNPEIALAVWSTTTPTLPPITGLILWLDSSVFSSLTLSGSNITAIADQSGAGNNMGNAGQPIYSATGLNTRPTMNFAGNTAFTKTGFAFGTGNTLTLFYVGTLTGTTTAFGRVASYKAGGSNDADNNASFLVGRDNTNNGITLFRNSSVAARAVTLSTPFRVICTITGSGVMSMYVNGVQTTGSTLNAAFGASGTLFIGEATDGTSGYIGSISELGIAQGLPSSVPALDNYLAVKWGF